MATTTSARCSSRPDGYRIVDFEGEPTRPLEERARIESPLRDVASMLRSLDHVGRSAGRRAGHGTGGPSRRRASTSTAGCVGLASDSSRPTRAGLREAGARISGGPGPSSVPSRSTRSAASSSTRRLAAVMAVGADRGDARAVRGLRPQSGIAGERRAELAEPVDRLGVEGDRKTKMTSPTPISRYPSRKAATSAAARRRRGPGRSRRIRRRPPSPWRRAMLRPGGTGGVRVIADDGMDRHGPLDGFERPADLGAALTQGPRWPRRSARATPYPFHRSA